MCKRALLTILAVAIIAGAAHAQKLKPEEIVAKNLDSIAPIDVRAAFKTFIAVGEVTVNYVTQKNPSASGRVVLASAGDRSFIGYSLNASDYPSERIVFDGNKTSVDFVRPGNRSTLGNFIISNGALVSNGLFGGVLSTNWAMMKTEARRPKLSSQGTKKIDGREVYALGYSPRGGGDLDITLFFDKETFRHVRTEYTRTSSASIGRTIDESARQSETRFKIVENFADFRNVKGLVMPHTYSLQYLVTGANGTTEIVWNYVLTEFAVNQPIEDATFAVRAG